MQQHARAACSIPTIALDTLLPKRLHGTKKESKEEQSSHCGEARALHSGYLNVARDHEGRRKPPTDEFSVKVTTDLGPA